MFSGRYKYLAGLLDETCQVEVVGSATESEAGLRLCAELRPDAFFVHINLPGKDGVSLATQLAMLPQPPRLVFTTGNANRATDAFRLEAVDYLLKPLDPGKSRRRSIVCWPICGPLRLALLRLRWSRQQGPGTG
jgi:DNA-binding LytR/AlgR family response regulator